MLFDVVAATPSRANDTFAGGPEVGGGGETQSFRK